ncbi:hypothetical protein DFP72DRAFT_858190 [Ephemerocybe angulata]|uniref:Uncharacterized protein n=1 Tax=Ephemerocybe angulata TaxID=980116 RepID=A0A8H6HDM6_9AGAR|nr:hypothetical protein DFP72DRAFT_858190 [Tulosesus angulatus]
MKVTIPTILLGILSLSTCAFAYLDYNELDARDSTNSLLVERNTVEVPFQHSLRSFLEEAADAHRRALDDHDDLLEARSDTVSAKIILRLNGEWTGKELNVPSPKSWTVQDAQKNAMWSNLLSGAKCKFRRGAASITNVEIPSLKTVKDGEVVILDCQHPDAVNIQLAITKGTDTSGRLPMFVNKHWDAKRLLAELNLIAAYTSLKGPCKLSFVPAGSPNPQGIDSLQEVPKDGRVIISCK